MLEKLQSIASFIAPARVFFGVSILAFALLFVANILSLEPLADHGYTIWFVIGFLWSLSLFSFIGHFQIIPPPVDSKLALLKRLKARAIRFGYWLLAILTLAVNVGVLFLTFRLVLI